MNNYSAEFTKRRTGGLKRPPQIWVVASGKGGVGKTFVTASLGLTLSKLGHSVTIVDLDFNGANLHTALGVEPAKVSLRHYFEGTKNLSEVVTPCPYPHLSFIQGLWDTWAPLEFKPDQIQTLINEMRSLPTDYILIDVSPGYNDQQLELMRLADEKILVSTPEPTSIEKTYRFLESHVCYSLKEIGQGAAYTDLIKNLRNHRQQAISKPFSFRDYLREHANFSPDPFDGLKSRPIRLVMNASRSQEDSELGYSIRSVCNKYFDLHIDFIGSFDYDNAVWQSVRNREPVLIAQPFTPLAGQFLTICKHLIDPSELKAVV